ncbi:MAG: hypothetical protein K2X81_21150, partial [Candidatus Obscuribacterales bacterium]|nr:hypothetical protein [Candidatus Obscuribacterales bacterium]
MDPTASATAPLACTDPQVDGKVLDAQISCSSIGIEGESDVHVVTAQSTPSGQYSDKPLMEDKALAAVIDTVRAQDTDGSDLDNDDDDNDDDDGVAHVGLDMKVKSYSTSSGSYSDGASEGKALSAGSQESDSDVESDNHHPTSTESNSNNMNPTMSNISAPNESITPNYYNYLGSPGYLNAAITVSEFFYSMLKFTVADEIRKYCNEMAVLTKLRDIFCSGLMNYNHYVNLNFTPTRKELLQCFCRSAAIFCKTNQARVDLIIPVHLGGPLIEENMSYILIQSKNYASSGKSNDFLTCATSHLSAHYAGIEDVPRNLYISMYIGLGGKTK